MFKIIKARVMWKRALGAFADVEGSDQPVDSYTEFLDTRTYYWYLQSPGQIEPFHWLILILTARISSADHGFYMGRAMRKRVFAHMQIAKPWSAFASAHSDQGLHCPVTESLDTTECMNGRVKARKIPCPCAGLSEYAYFAHVRRHFFF